MVWTGANHNDLHALDLSARTDDTERGRMLGEFLSKGEYDYLSLSLSLHTSLP